MKYRLNPSQVEPIIFKTIIMAQLIRQMKNNPCNSRLGGLRIIMLHIIWWPSILLVQHQFSLYRSSISKYLLQVESLLQPLHWKFSNLDRMATGTNNMTTCKGTGTTIQTSRSHTANSNLNWENKKRQAQVRLQETEAKQSNHWWQWATRVHKKEHLFMKN